MRGVWRALTNPVYRKLFIAQVVALAGTGLATVALGLLAYRLDPARAAGVLGTALAIKMVAYVFVAPLATAAVARWSRRSVMVGADLLRVVVAVALPFVGEVWQVYVLVFVLQAASATFTPTFQSVIPDVLTEEDDFTAALSLSRLAYDLESVLSPMAAAALLLFVPSQELFFGTAIGFAGSAALVVSTVLPARPRGADGGAPESPFSHRVRHGFVLFVQTPALRPVLALNLAVAAAGSFVIVQTVVIARTVFGQGEEVVAWLLVANGLGSMIGAFGLPGLLRTVPERRLMLGGAALLAVGSLLVPLGLALAPSGWGIVVVAALWLAIGLGWAAAETPVGRLIRRNTASGDIGAVFAAQFSLSHACWLLTYPLAGWLGTAGGLAPAALTLAGLATASTLLAARLWPSPDPVLDPVGAR